MRAVFPQRDLSDEEWELIDQLAEQVRARVQAVAGLFGVRELSDPNILGSLGSLVTSAGEVGAKRLFSMDVEMAAAIVRVDAQETAKEDSDDAH